MPQIHMFANAIVTSVSLEAGTISLIVVGILLVDVITNQLFVPFQVTYTVGCMLLYFSSDNYNLLHLGVRRDVRWQYNDDIQLCDSSHTLATLSVLPQSVPFHKHPFSSSETFIIHNLLFYSYIFSKSCRKYIQLIQQKHQNITRSTCTLLPDILESS
jgi:hypothetical protein